MSEKKRIFISAGEVSGDMHGADLMAAIRKAHPDILFRGLGGQFMRAAGLDPIADDLSTYSSTGFIEFIPFIGKHLATLSRSIEELKRGGYKTAILIDNQGFNIELAKAAKKLGMKVFYYFPPHVSIWGAKAAPALAAATDCLVPSLPADHEVYSRHTDHSFFLGHPLIDRLSAFESGFQGRDAFLEELGIPSGARVLSLFPGSRRQELKALLGIFLDAAALIAEKCDAWFIIPVSHPSFAETIRAAAASHPLSARIRVVDNRAYEVMASCDVNIMSSGTAVLESALLGKPVVLCYRISGITFFIGRIVVKRQMVGLPNIILDRKFIPELLQEECNPRKIAGEALARLSWDDASVKAYLADCATVRDRMGKPGVIGRVAEKAFSMTGF